MFILVSDYETAIIMTIMYTRLENILKQGII